MKARRARGASGCGHAGRQRVRGAREIVVAGSHRRAMMAASPQKSARPLWAGAWQAVGVAGAETASLPHAGRAPGVALAVASMTTIQLGAALSEPMFDGIGVAGTVALRLALAALILWPFARPRLRGRSREDLGAAVALGACSGLLTLAFFEAISRIPLGVAVTIEFLGPLGVALAGSRRPRDVGWVLAAGAGVALLTLGDGAGEPLDATGVAFALVSAVCWAGYILLTKRVGARWPGLEGLSVSLVVAALDHAAGRDRERRRGARRARASSLAGIGLALLIPLLPYASSWSRSGASRPRCSA